MLWVPWLLPERESCSREGADNEAVGGGDAAKKIWQLSQPSPPQIRVELLMGHCTLGARGVLKLCLFCCFQTKTRVSVP